VGAREGAGHAPLAGAAVDRKQRGVDGEGSQPVRLSVVGNAVARVVDAEGTEAHHVAEMSASPALVALDLLVRGRNARDAEARRLDLRAVVEAHRPRGIDPQ